MSFVSTARRMETAGIPVVSQSAPPHDLHRSLLGVIMRTAKLFTFVLLFALSASYAKDKAPATPQDKSAECLACHSDPGLAKDVNGKAVSLHVDEGKFKNSIHGSMFGCTDCHKDVKS